MTARPGVSANHVNQSRNGWEGVATNNCSNDGDMIAWQAVLLVFPLIELSAIGSCWEGDTAKSPATLGSAEAQNWICEQFAEQNAKRSRDGIVLAACDHETAEQSEISGHG